MSEPDTLLDPETPARTLDALRFDIDRIDEALHGLLMERAEIIDRLIAVKARQGGGSAFRPEREAAMMRRLVSRHAGILPLDTVESIWRIIISTFTYVQAPYSVHADAAAGDAAMRDSGRFHFGFTVPLVMHDGAAAVIASVAAGAGDLGIIRADGGPGSAWWTALTDPGAPKIIARLPFVERSERAASLPLYVVAKPLAAPPAGDVALYAQEGQAHLGQAQVGQARPDGIAIIADSGEGRTLIAVPAVMPLEAVARALDVPTSTLVWIGSHARQFQIDEGYTNRNRDA